jgi:predicted MFS family arabinose efflux permease
MSDPSPGPRPTLAVYLRLVVFAAVHAVGSMAYVSIVAMAPAIRPALGLSATALGVIVATYSAMQAVLGLPIGSIIDRIGVRRSLIAACVLTGAGAWSMSVAASFPGAVAAMALIGLGYAFVNPATSKGVLEWLPAKRRATGMGIKQSGVPLGGVLGAGVGALLVHADWRHLIHLVTVMAALVLIPCLFLPPTPQRDAGWSPRRMARDLRVVLLDGNLGWYNLGIGIYQAGQFSLFAYITLFMRETMMASQPLAAACLGIANVASATGRLGWGALSDFGFGGRRKPVQMIVGSTAAAALLLLVVVPPGWGVWLAVAIAAVAGLTVAGHVALSQTIVVESAERRLAATAIGYNRILTGLGGMAGPPLFGLAVDLTGGYRAGWLVTAALVGSGTLVIALLFREKPRDGR